MGSNKMSDHIMAGPQSLVLMSFLYSRLCSSHHSVCSKTYICYNFLRLGTSVCCFSFSEESRILIACPDDWRIPTPNYYHLLTLNDSVQMLHPYIWTFPSLPGWAFSFLDLSKTLKFAFLMFLIIVLFHHAHVWCSSLSYLMQNKCLPNVTSFIVGG